LPFTLRADTSARLLGPNLPRALNDAFSKSTNVKSTATYNIPIRDTRKRIWRSDIDLRRYSVFAAVGDGNCPSANRIFYMKTCSILYDLNQCRI
jgi:hypothetical protein